MPVQLVLFTQAFGGSESGDVASRSSTRSPPLNDKVTVVEKSFVLDTEDKAKYKVDKAPAIVILSDGIDTRMRMRRADRLRVRGLRRSDHRRRHRQDRSRPRDDDVDSGGRQADPHPGVFDTDVTALSEGGRPRTKMAAANELITADAIEATEFMDLSRKYRVTGEDDRQRDDRDHGGPAGKDVREGRPRLAGIGTCHIFSVFVKMWQVPFRRITDAAVPPGSFRGPDRRAPPRRARRDRRLTASASRMPRCSRLHPCPGDCPTTTT